MTDNIINSKNSQKMSVYCKTCVCRGCHTGQEFYNQGMWHGMAIGSKEELDRLKAENERLEALCDTYKTCYQAKHSDIKCLFVKYKQTLQEIKAIAEELLEKGLEPQSVEHQLRLRGKRELASIIVNLITKAEEE